MPLIPGPRLTPAQQRQVQAAFPQATDHAWMTARAFPFTRHGLLKDEPYYLLRDYAEPESDDPDDDQA